MPGVSFHGAGQDDPWTIACRDHRPQGRIGAGLQLFAGDEAGEYCLGCEDAGRLPERSAEGRSRKQNAVSGPQDRSRPRRCHRLLRRLRRRRPTCRGSRRQSGANRQLLSRHRQQQIRQPAPAQAAQPAPNSDASYISSDAKYTLRSGIAEGRMVYIGVGGAIEGKVNPVLTAAEGQVVELTLINGEGAEHDIVFPDQNAKSPRVTGKGSSTTIAFRAEKAGDFIYFCSVPGHQLAGMQGQFIVTSRPAPQTLVEADISREPTDLPPPIGKREPQTVRVDLLSVEVEGRLAEGTTFGYWTFNGKVPGPFIRVRVGDTVDIHLKNSADSAMIHSVDFHATTGPGGGAAALQVDPGQEKSMTLEGAGAWSFRLSLRHADGFRAHRQRHVRSHSGRTGRRPAASRSRVLRDAGRNLHRCALWTAWQRGIQRREAAERAIRNISFSTARSARYRSCIRCGPKSATRCASSSASAVRISRRRST